MAMSAPELPSWLHFAQVSYECRFGQTQTPDGRVTFGCPQPVMFMFAFETSRTQPNPQVDLWNVTWDYSWFDQATSEAGIAQALGGICADIAVLVGSTTAAIEATVTVQRVWAATANQQGNAAAEQTDGATITEVMPYPPAALGGAACGSWPAGGSVPATARVTLGGLNANRAETSQAGTPARMAKPGGRRAHLNNAAMPVPLNGGRLAATESRGYEEGPRPRGLGSFLLGSAA